MRGTGERRARQKKTEKTVSKRGRREGLDSKREGFREILLQKLFKAGRGGSSL